MDERPADHKPAGLDSQPSRRFQLALIALALANWFFLYGRHGISGKEIAALSAALLAAVLPGAGGFISSIMSRSNRALSHRRLLACLCASIAFAAVLLFQVRATGSSLFSRMHDEHVYLIQARMLSAGRLWFPAYPPSIRPFFDEFYLINDPVYAPMYFPGTALLMLPALWLRWPHWITPFIAASVSAGLLYLIVEEFLQPVLAAFSILLLMSVPAFRNAGLLLLSQMPAAMMILLALWAWLRFNRTQNLAWVRVLGAALGFAAIIRPLDTACFAVPVIIATVLQMRGRPRRLAAAVAPMTLLALPFLVLQLVQNTGITGHWWQFPESYYNARNFPAPIFGFHPVELNHIPHFASPAKNQAMRDLALPAFSAHEFSAFLTSYYSGRFKSTLTTALPDPLLVIFLPLGLLVFCDRRRWVLASAIALFLIGYALFAFYLAHYVVPIVPVVICLTMLGLDAAIKISTPGSRMSAALLVAVFTLCVGSLPPFQKLTFGAQGAAPVQSAANAALGHLSGRGVVLFKFDPAHMTWPDDPVYNDTVAYPDDARIIRVWDLGEEADQDLYQYYHQRQPDRAFYIFDLTAGARAEERLTGISPSITGTGPSTYKPRPPD
jgi:hypothetical protein